MLFHLLLSSCVAIATAQPNSPPHELVTKLWSIIHDAMPAPTAAEVVTVTQQKTYIREVVTTTTVTVATPSVLYQDIDFVCSFTVTVDPHPETDIVTVTKENNYYREVLSTTTVTVAAPTPSCAGLADDPADTTLRISTWFAGLFTKMCGFLVGFAIALVVIRGLTEKKEQMPSPSESSEALLDISQDQERQKEYRDRMKSGAEQGEKYGDEIESSDIESDASWTAVA